MSMVSASMDSALLHQTDRPVRWAVVGTGSIAASFARDIALAPSASLVSVCSRSPEAADAFSRRFGPLSLSTDLTALAQDASIDAVYVASPNSAHAAQVATLLAVGKPVLCEKTLTTSLSDTDALISQARALSSFLMEALWLLYLPAIQRLRAVLASGTIGTIRAVRGELAFHKPFNAEDRFFSAALGGGALLDLGIYPIALTLSLFGKPGRVEGSWRAAPSGVDSSAAMRLDYSGFSAALSCSFDRTGRNAFVIEGERGTLILDGPFIAARRLIQAEGGVGRLLSEPSSGRLAAGLRRAVRLLPNVHTEDLPFAGSGLQFEIEAASRAIRAGQAEEETAPHWLTRSAAAIIETIRTQTPHP